MTLSTSSKAFGVREFRVQKLLTDNAGAAATYSVTAGSVASAPTTTGFTMTAGNGAAFTTADPTGSIVGRALNIIAAGTGVVQVGIVATLAGEVVTLSNTLALAPTIADVVNLPTSYALPGAISLASMPTVKTIDLRGNNTFLDTDSVLQTLEFDVHYAKHQLDVLALTAGGTVVSAGTTPNQSNRWSLLATPTFGYFRFEARCASADYASGDIHIICNKAKAAELPFPGFIEEDYDRPHFKMKAVPPIGTTRWIDVVELETALPIA